MDIRKKLVLHKEYLLALLIFIIVFAKFDKIYKQQSPNVTSDGYYYYLYLPAYFFTSMDFEPFYKIHNSFNFKKNPVTNKFENGFAIGPAIMLSPFFAYANIRYGEKYNTVPPYQRAFGTQYEKLVCRGSFLYSWAGFLILFIWLSRKFRPMISLIAVLSIATASFMPWYYIKEPGMSHGVSFFLSTVFICFWFWNFEKDSWKTRKLWKYFIVGIILGMCTITRLQILFYGIVFAIEFLTVIKENKNEIPSGIKKILLSCLLLGCGFFIAFIPQMLVWKTIYGEYFTFPQKSHYVQYARPLITDILFSTRNGLFTWSPIMYFATIGLIFLPRKMRFQGLLLVIIIISQIYLNSCIQDWWCGYSLSLRRMAGELPVWALALAFIFSFINEQFQKRPYPAVIILLGAIAYFFYFINPAVNYNIKEWSELTSRSVSLDSLYSKGISNRLKVMHAQFGSPLCFPVNYYYALKYNIHPFEYDTIIGQYFLDGENNFGDSITFSNPDNQKFIRSNMIPLNNPKVSLLSEPQIKFLAPFLARSNMNLHLTFSPDSQITSDSLKLNFNGKIQNCTNWNFEKKEITFSCPKEDMTYDINSIIYNFSDGLFPKVPVTVLHTSQPPEFFADATRYPLHDIGHWLIYFNGKQNSINLFQYNKSFEILANFLNTLITQRRNEWQSLLIYSQRMKAEQKNMLSEILHIKDIPDINGETSIIIDENGSHFLNTTNNPYPEIICTNIPLIIPESLKFERLDKDMKIEPFK